MASKLYRSANGKTVDMGKLLLQNEHVMAVGNMNVNARGDQLNTKTQRSIQTRAETVTKHYEKQVQSNVVDEPIYSTIPEKKPVAKTKAASKPKPQAEKKTAKKEKVEELEIVDFDEEVFSEIPLAEVEAEAEPEAVEEAPAESGGLAAAIARAKEVKQEPLPKPGTPTKPSRF